MTRGAEGSLIVSQEELYDVLGVDPDEERRMHDDAVFHELVDGLDVEEDLTAETVFFANDLEVDRRTRLRIAETLGILAVEGIVSTTTPELNKAEKASLVQVAEDYYSDDPEIRAAAEARLMSDFGTNVFEILRASGHISQSHSEYVGDGFYQNGYSQLWMYAHGVLHAHHPTERGRRIHETLNEGRIEDGFVDGMFETHYFVEESRAPFETEMAAEDADEHGYNIATWKVMLRLTDVDESGHRVTESASVSGVDGNGIRRDSIGLQNIRDMLGLSPDADLSDVVIPVDGLEGAYWVNKQVLKNRSASLAEFFDGAFEGDNFFGVEGETGDYETILEVSQDREAQVAEQMSARVSELAAALRGLSCEQALLVMAQHAKDFATDVCVMDTSYDAGQFGETAAKYIEIARYETEFGDEDAARRAIELAKATAIVYMCGVRLDMDRVRSDGSSDDDEAARNETFKDCDYISKECPLCHDKNVKTHETATSITCGSCKQSVTKRPAPVLALAA